MAPISLDQLYQIIEKQDLRIASLQAEITKLKIGLILVTSICKK